MNHRTALFGLSSTVGKVRCFPIVPSSSAEGPDLEQLLRRTTTQELRSQQLGAHLRRVLRGYLDDYNHA